MKDVHLTLTEAAERAKRPKSTIWYAIDRKDLRARFRTTPFGRAYMIDPVDLRRWLRSRGRR
jgi:hypothetical protein